MDALRSIYAATNGARWQNNTGWLGTDNEPCEGWFGVLCDDSGTNIARLEFSNLGLDGTLPSQIGELSRLSFVSITDSFDRGAQDARGL